MQKRITLLVVASVLIVLVSMSVISYISVRASIDNSLQSRLALASIIGENIDYVLRRNIARLREAAAAAPLEGLEAVRALRDAYERSIFTEGVFAFDADGRVTLRYPPKSGAGVSLFDIPAAKETLQGGGTLVSGAVSSSSGEGMSLYVIVPVKRAGRMAGAVGGEIDPANYMFTQIITSVSALKNTRVELIDSQGVIISSNDPGRILTNSDHDKFLSNLISQKKTAVGECHRCHDQGGQPAPKRSDTLVFAPLPSAPWGISIREPRETVFAPATIMRNAFIVMGLIYVATAVFLAMSLSNSIVRPIQTLTRATKKIAREELSEPIEIPRDDELGALARSFDTMRVRLSESLGSVRKYGVELEKRVLDRTYELQKQRKQLATLLDQVIRAQEEERKRIARELHDETSQSILALGMSLELAALALMDNRLKPETLLESRKKAEQMLEGINRLIHDLRPPALDDLGLNSAIRWLLETRLASQGISCRLEPCEGALEKSDDLMDKTTELRLFRVIQEAVINIARHARAKNVTVSITCGESTLKVDIIDDGVGFDIDEVFLAIEAGPDAGFGLIGMRERVAHLDGKLDIWSEPGEGTRVTIKIPIGKKRDDDS